MALFDDREKAFEAKFQHDEELSFKITARRDKLLGLWVAAQLGLAGEAADSYAQSIVAADLSDSRHEAMIAKLHADLAAGGKDVTPEKLAAEMDRLLQVAHDQVTGDNHG